ncbi:hypothetical protein Vafri_8408, partial [Volvox africanus]
MHKPRPEAELPTSGALDVNSPYMRSLAACITCNFQAASAALSPCHVPAVGTVLSFASATFTSFRSTHTPATHVSLPNAPKLLLLPPRLRAHHHQHRQPSPSVPMDSPPYITLLTSRRRCREVLFQRRDQAVECGEAARNCLHGQAPRHVSYALRCVWPVRRQQHPVPCDDVCECSRTA